MSNVKYDTKWQIIWKKNSTNIKIQANFRNFEMWSLPVIEIETMLEWRDLDDIMGTKKSFIPSDNKIEKWGRKTDVLRSRLFHVHIWH